MMWKWLSKSWSTPTWLRVVRMTTMMTEKQDRQAMLKNQMLSNATLQQLIWCECWYAHGVKLTWWIITSAQAALPDTWKGLLCEIRTKTGYVSTITLAAPNPRRNRQTETLVLELFHSAFPLLGIFTHRRYIVFTVGKLLLAMTGVRCTPLTYGRKTLRYCWEILLIKPMVNKSLVIEWEYMLTSSNSRWHSYSLHHARWTTCSSCSSRLLFYNHQTSALQFPSWPSSSMSLYVGIFITICPIQSLNI